MVSMCWNLRSPSLVTYLCRLEPPPPQGALQGGARFIVLFDFLRKQIIPVRPYLGVGAPRKAALVVTVNAVLLLLLTVVVVAVVVVVVVVSGAPAGAGDVRQHLLGTRPGNSS